MLTSQEKDRMRADADLGKTYAYGSPLARRDCCEHVLKLLAEIERAKLEPMTAMVTNQLPIEI